MKGYSVLITTMARRLLTPDVVADSCARLSWCHHTASKAATTALLLTTMFFGVSVFSSFIAVVNQTVQKLVIKADYLIITTREGGGGDDEDEDEVSGKRKERAYSLAWCYLALERKSWSRGVAPMFLHQGKKKKNGSKSPLFMLTIVRLAITIWWMMSHRMMISFTSWRKERLQ